MRNFCVVIVADNENTENENAERLRSVGGRISQLAARVNKVRGEAFFFLYVPQPVARIEQAMSA